MPELPEVETVARRLQARLPGATIRGADVRWSRTIAYPQPAERFAMEVFNYSVVYLMALFAFLLADHWLSPPPPAGPVFERIAWPTSP